MWKEILKYVWLGFYFIFCDLEYNEALKTNLLILYLAAWRRKIVTYASIQYKFMSQLCLTSGGVLN